jgi:YhcH/YjgK/YiaL family protein
MPQPTSPGPIFPWTAATPLNKNLVIIDHLDHANRFHALGIGIRAGLQFLARPDLHTLEKGRYDLPDSGGSYALIQEHETKLRTEAKWEAHRKMIDLQFMIRGQELMGYADISRLKMEEYHGGDDYCLGEGDGDWLRLDEQYFMILFPQDGHMPSIAVNEPQPVRKAVVKIPVETLPILSES